MGKRTVQPNIRWLVRFFDHLSRHLREAERSVWILQGVRIFFGNGKCEPQRHLRGEELKCKFWPGKVQIHRQFQRCYGDVTSVSVSHLAHNKPKHTRGNEKEFYFNSAHLLIHRAVNADAIVCCDWHNLLRHEAQTMDGVWVTCQAMATTNQEQHAFNWQWTDTPSEKPS